MKRKIFALLLCMVFICTLSLPVYADSTTTSSDGYSVLISDIPTTCPTCSGSLSASWASTSGAEVEVQISDSGSIKIPAGAGSFAYIKLRCKSCGYEKSETRLLGLDFGNEKPGNLHVEKAPSGIGRKDLPGYESSDNNPGVPSISQDGNIALLAKYRFTNNQKQLVDSFSKQVDNDIWNFGENSLYIERYSKNSSRCYTYCGYILDTHNVPGIYYVPAGTSYVFNPWGDSNVRNLNGKEWPENTSLYVGSSSSDGSKRYLCIYRYNADKTYDSYRYPEMHWSIGDGTDDIFGQDSGYSISTSGNITIPYPKDLVVYLRPTSTNIVKNTNVIINNNDYSQTWNGNIYTDNSTNLTYIYPQYTTVNEKNETVTNISNTPIVYNNETKQYYTYDQTTKNYYYITYNENPTTPTPSPSPTPDPDKPSVTPTPTPTPGGDTGDNSGGSTWNPFKWLTDLLKDIVETILKGLWKLLTSIFGFILWLLSLLFKLFPWMPNSGILALCAGVVVVTVIRIIKFITGR